MLIGEENKKKTDILYAVLFILTLMPLQFLCGVFGLTQFDIWSFGGTVTLILALVLIADCAAELVKRVRKWRENKLSAGLAEKVI